jgi:ribosomal protein S27AE
MAKDIQCMLQIKRQELAKCCEKLNIALHQNVGNRATCGNCHLKLGHTKKICEYSPCESAYLCGSLTKHSSEKMVTTTLEMGNQCTKRDPKRRTCGRQSAHISSKTDSGDHCKRTTRQIHLF